MQLLSEPKYDTMEELLEIIYEVREGTKELQNIMNR